MDQSPPSPDPRPFGDVPQPVPGRGEPTLHPDAAAAPMGRTAADGVRVAPPDHPDFRPPDETGGGDRIPRGNASIAWIAILLVVGAFLGLRGIGPGSEAEADAEAADDIAEVMIRLQGGYAVGAMEMLPSPGGPEQMLGQLRPALEMGTPRQRMRYAVLAADLAGGDEGQAVIDRMDALIPNSATVPELTAEDARARDLLVRIFVAMNGDGDSAITDADRDFLIEHLGWYGQLGAGLDPTSAPTLRREVVDDAKRTTIGFFVAFGGIAIVGLVGTVLLVTAVVLFALGRLRATRAIRPDLHGLLGETFAVWLPLFLGFQLVGGLVLSAAVEGTPTTRQSMVVGLIGFWGSMIALGWPIVRGLSVSNTLGAVGLHRGRGIIREVGAGIVAWMAAVPMLGVGLLLTFLLMVAVGMAGGGTVGGDPLAPAVGPAHPIIGELASGDPVLVILILLLGAMAAPVVEEVFFRGCLFAQLRDAAAGWDRFLAVIVASVVSSVLFAAIHPQGLVAIPALSSLAIAFCLAREWRGSLIAPIVMHAINNGLVLGGLVLILG